MEFRFYASVPVFYPNLIAAQQYNKKKEYTKQHRISSCAQGGAFYALRYNLTFKLQLA